MCLCLVISISRRLLSTLVVPAMRQTNNRATRHAPSNVVVAPVVVFGLRVEVRRKHGNGDPRQS
jgi:hypothetical protein